jgi:hypothetical protein
VCADYIKETSEISFVNSLIKKYIQFKVMGDNYIITFNNSMFRIVPQVKSSPPPPPPSFFSRTPQ